MIRVTVWEHRAVDGFDGDNEDEIFTWPVMELSEALAKVYETDAQCVPYYMEGLDDCPRVNKLGFKALEADGEVLTYDSVWYDIDCPKAVKAFGQEWVYAWVSEQWARFRDLYPGYGGYVTRNGFRVIIPMQNAGADNYRLGWQTGHNRLSENFEVDPLADPQRCYRLPIVHRSDDKHQGKVAGEYVLPTCDPLTVDTSLAVSGSSRLPAVVGKARTMVPEVVTEGRNQTLFGIGGALRRMGFSLDAMYAALAVTNSEICSPPLGAAELRVLVDKQEKYDRGSLVRLSGVRPGDGLVLDLGSEAEMADWVLRQIEKEGHHCVWDQGRLRVYQEDVGYWIELEENVVADMILDLDGAWSGGSGKGAGKIKVDERKIKGVWSIIKRKRAREGYFESVTPGVVFSDGRVDLGGFGSRLASHKDTWRVDESLKEWHGAKPWMFLSFLDDAFGGLDDGEVRIGFIQEFIGACLMGLAVDFQKVVLFTGRGANGKSVLLDIVGAMFPPEVQVAVPPQKFSDQFYLAEMAGARINLVSEVPESEMMLTGAFKALATGDLVSAAFKYGKVFKFRSRCGQLFAANSLPSVRDLSDAFWRRWVVVDWPRVVALGDRDERLASKIIGAELGGIVLWAISGAKRLVARGGYLIPPSSRGALEKWKEGADQVSLFSAEIYGGLENGAFVENAVVYQRYQLWTIQNGFGKMNRRKLTKRMESLGWVPDRRTHARGLVKVLEVCHTPAADLEMS